MRPSAGEGKVCAACAVGADFGEADFGFSAGCVFPVGCTGGSESEPFASVCDAGCAGAGESEGCASSTAGAGANFCSIFCAMPCAVCSTFWAVWLSCARTSALWVQYQIPASASMLMAMMMPKTSRILLLDDFRFFRAMEFFSYASSCVNCLLRRSPCCL